MAHYTDYRFRY